VPVTPAHPDAVGPFEQPHQFSWAPTPSEPLEEIIDIGGHAEEIVQVHIGRRSGFVATPAAHTEAYIVFQNAKKR